jgi:hypothetical protein
MATTTTNFGWDIPQSTDLVKDGATAIAALGQDIDTSMMDLKGGTTGQVLKKASNTDMDFTWSSETGDIEGVTAGTGLTGGGTSGTVTLDFDVANYGGGQYSAGKNKIINGDFGIWQRGTSSLTFSNVTTFTADHWWNIVSGGTPTCTTTRQSADTAGQTYGLRFGRNSGQTQTGDIWLGQTLESTDAKKLAGQTVTVSFYVKKGADAPTTFKFGAYTGTGTDQGTASLWAGTWTGTANVTGSSTVTTTMTRYSAQLTLAANTNEVLFYFGYTSTGTAGANEWIQIEGVQVEAGSVATPFQTATGTKQGELAACYRYLPVTLLSAGTIGVIGQATGSGTAYYTVPFMTEARTQPTGITITAGTLKAGTATFGDGGGTGVFNSSQLSQGQIIVTGASGLTAGHASYLYPSATCKILWTGCEL